MAVLVQQAQFHLAVNGAFKPPAALQIKSAIFKV
jgi:hypothetical protein